MLADSKLPTTFWAEAVSTACYVQNRVLVVKPHNKTPYELFRGIKPAIGFMKPFGCHVTILNTLDKLASLMAKENLHVGFLENKPMLEGNGPKWLFDLDSLTQSMNYVPVVAGSSSNVSAGTQEVSEYLLKSVVMHNIQDQDVALMIAVFQDVGFDRITKMMGLIHLLKNTEGSSIDLGNLSTHLMRFFHSSYKNSQGSSKVICDWRCAYSVQTRRMNTCIWSGFLSAIYRRKKESQDSYMPFCCFLSQKNQRECLKLFCGSCLGRGMLEDSMFKLQNADAQGHTQEEGIDYDEVFAPVARIEAIRIFLAYASFMGFTVYQMGCQKAFLYGQWKRWCIRSLCEEFEKLMKDKFQMSSMGELTFFLGLQVQQRKKGIFISQDKYVHEILKKFNYTDVKSASTPTDLEKPLVKDADADDVDEHLYRSMIGSLMYLTASRPDIMFAVCACARFQVSPKTSHLLAVKRIFRYLKGKPSLGLWYSGYSPLELVAYTDSDYAGATLDRKSTTGGCQFLGNRLISWQCKKQTVVATSTTEAEYVAAASCCGQVLWIQNQLLDYGYRFMNTVIYIDITSTICIIENPVQHSKTKHIEIRHHFIRDCNTKKLIQMAKIDTQLNVADLLTKGFDAGRFQYLVSSIGMLNP
ncbi:putative ribonuclease H-like domain-containing protein [Tanacetum coccineum]